MKYLVIVIALALSACSKPTYGFSERDSDRAYEETIIAVLGEAPIGTMVSLFKMGSYHCERFGCDWTSETALICNRSFDGETAMLDIRRYRAEQSPTTVSEQNAALVRTCSSGNARVRSALEWATTREPGFRVYKINVPCTSYRNAIVGFGRNSRLCSRYMFDEETGERRL